MATGRNSDDEVSVDETMLETDTYHNRDFQRYAIEHGVYFVPIDDDEIERLNVQHGALQILFQGQLFFPRSMNRSPRRVLDCGFGTGSWAIEVATRYPECEVFGVDIWANMIDEDVEIPRNFLPQVDDLNKDFTWSRNMFDFVHSQMVCGGIHRNQWQRYLRDIHRVLVPGGWAQMVEIYFNAQSDNGTLTDGHALRRWSSKYIQAMQTYKDPRAPMRLKGWMESAGFVDVEQQQLVLPMCDWSRSERSRDAGAANRANVHKLLSSLAVYPFTQALGMSLDDVHLLVAQARREADNASFKAYFPVYVCVGRKSR